ncbi:putative purine permease 11 [Acorus gramineus]|uniref:Probable purine permease n=1 Tax=Acorus gramineus TaxID=55184 RepID=A0AAV9BAA5_ACOGR|nr:putative purine permease 11 [Acorus gramineus]
MKPSQNHHHHHHPNPRPSNGGSQSPSTSSSSSPARPPPLSSATSTTPAAAIASGSPQSSRPPPSPSSTSHFSSFPTPPPLTTTTTTTTDLHRPPSMAKLALIYIFIGLLIAGDDLMYSYGLLYLPVSTYALICATQLAFNAVFSYFINHQKFTHLIFNSVVLLTFSAALLGVNSDSEGSDTKPSAGKYAIGFACTLGASAAYSLILSLMQFSFENVIRRETFAVVLDMQIYTAFVATSASVVGLFASGEWRTLKGEMEGFEKGKVSYVMILVWTAVAWQVASVGVVGLIFEVSSLFSNVISTLSLPVVPVFAVIFFHDKINGVKVIAMLLAIWGFASYIYQHYIDDVKAKKARSQVPLLLEEEKAMVD